MKLKYTYCLLFALFSFALSAQNERTAEIAQGVFYLKISDTETAASGNTKQKALSIADLKTSRHFNEMIPVSIGKQQTANTKSVLDGLYRVYVDETTDIERLIDSLSQFDNVIYAEPVYQEELLYTPDDTQLSIGNQPYLEVIKALDAWNISKGSNKIKIGIIDTGVDLGHEDILGKIFQNANDPVNGIDDDKNGYIDDFEGYDLADDDPVAHSVLDHGVRVSGLACAATDNEKGIAGVGFNTLLVPLKVFKSEDHTAGGNYEAILYAADNEIDIINISWGSVESYSQAHQDIITYAVLEKDVIIVAASGNQNNEERYFPASYDHVLSVSATNDSDEKASFSTYNYAVDIVAPGSSITSTTRNNNYGKDSGTSYSAPLVAGAAALVKSHYPNLNARQIMELLCATADDIYAVGHNMDYYGQMGKGRLNIFQSLSEDTVKAIRAENIHYYNGFDEMAYFGDTISLSFDIVNYLATVRNAGIQFSSTSEYVDFLMEEVHIGTLDTLESIPFNEQLFVLDPSTPPETEIAIRLDFFASEYEDFQYIVLKTEPDYVNLGKDKLRLTIAANGNLGYAEDELKNGIGMEWNGSRVVANPALLIARSASQVSDNLPLLADAHVREVDFATKNHLRLTKPKNADFMAKSSFSDDSASSPMGLIVDQRAFAYSDKDFLILEYRLINNSGDTLTNIASGLFLNWDVGIASENRSAYDPQNLALITYSKDNDLFAGVKTFFDQSPVYQALDIGDHNGNSIDLTDSISDAQKYELATNMNYDSAGMQGNGNDVANLLSQDSLVIPPYTSKKVTFLIALAIDADSLSSLLDEADSAYQKILAQPPLLETFYGCEGGTIQLNPSADSLFRFYTDPYAQNLISEGSELTVGPLSQDTVIYGVNIDGSFEGEIQRLNIVLLDNIADFSMSTDTLFLDDPQTNTVSFYDSSFFADHWEWNFDNGLQATIQHPTVNFTAPGTYEISLYVANTLGCAGERVKTLLVAERPEMPVIEDLIVCENASVTLAASNTDSIAIYQNKEDVVPIMQSPETRFDRITKDTCFYVTNITGPFESLKEEVCIRVDPARSSFTYAPDTTSTENKAIFTNTSQDIYQSKWYVDGAFESTGETVSIVIDKEEYTMALVNESSYGCIDSLSRSIIFPTSPTPDTGQITACYGQEVLLSPSNGTFFAFYADINMDSLIKKGRSLRIDSVVSKFSVFVTGLDSLLPSPVAELAIRPEQIQFSVVATPDTLILAQKRTARFETDSDSLVRWAWYKNGTFQESLSSPVLLFDSAAVYEIVLQAETALGCTVEDTLYYAVLAEEITIPLNVTDSKPVLLFPNPSNGIFSLANLKPGAEVIITNTFGKEIKRFSSPPSLLMIDISDKKPGIYMLTITQNNHSSYKKIKLE